MQRGRWSAERRSACELRVKIYFKKINTHTRHFGEIKNYKYASLAAVFVRNYTTEKRRRIQASGDRNRIASPNSLEITRESAAV